MKGCLARLLYWPALLSLIPSLIVSLLYDGKIKFASLVIGAAASSLIIYCKTYDWLLILALKRKHLDKAIGINTGCYFIVVMITSIVTFLYSYACLLINGGDTLWLATVSATAIFMICLFIVNLKDAYKADPDEVLKIIKFN